MVIDRVYYREFVTPVVKTWRAGGPLCGGVYGGIASNAVHVTKNYEVAKGGEFFGFLDGFLGLLQFGMEVYHQDMEKGSILEEGGKDIVISFFNILGKNGDGVIE